MARARNIKPGFFANEILAECEPLARLLFAGLWCLADRAGRLEDRPKRIRAELLPYDTCDADALLAQLQKHGFISRYEVDGAGYIQVLNFDKHQNPHMKEAKSTIPAKGYPSGFLMEEPAKESSIEDEHQASTVQAPDQHQASPADSGFSDSLIPDSLNREANASLSASAKRTVPNCPADELFDLYEAKLPTLPTVRRSLFKAGKNINAMRQRWAWVMTAKHERGNRAGQPMATTEQEGVEWFERYFAYAAESDFLTGKNGKWAGCDLAWLMTAGKFENVLTGKYHAMDTEVA